MLIWGRLGGVVEWVKGCPVGFLFGGGWLGWFRVGCFRAVFKRSRTNFLPLPCLPSFEWQQVLI